MTLPEHPGIDMVETMRRQHGYTADNWEENERIDNQILANLRTNKAALNLTLEKTAAACIDPADIARLRTFEVAVAWMEIRHNPDTPRRLGRLNAAISGRNWAKNGPADSSCYACRRDNALTVAQAGERVVAVCKFVPG